MSDLEKQLQNTDRFRRVLIIRRSLQHGRDIAPLKDIVDLAKKYQAITYVDDAHGDGVLGENGRGITNHFHSKERSMLTWEPSPKPSAVSAVTLLARKTYARISEQGPKLSPLRVQPPAIPGACIAAIQLVKKNPSLAKKLWTITTLLQESTQGPRLRHGTERDPITPVMGWCERESHKLADEMFQAWSIRFPIVFRWSARTRRESDDRDKRSYQEGSRSSSRRV